MNEIVAQALVSALLVRHFAGEASDGVVHTADGDVVDAGKGAGIDQRHPTRVELHAAAFQVRSLEAQLGVLHRLAEVCYARPSHLRPPR